MGVARAYIARHAYNSVELAEIDFEQTADTMYLAHIDHPPRTLVRAGHTNWTFSDITFGPSGAAPTGCSAAATTPNTDAANSGDGYFPQPATYVVTALNDTTGQESRASNSASATNDLTLKRNYNTVTWSAVTGADRYNVYKADNDQFYGFIGTTDGLTFRDDNISPALDQAPPEGFNPFSAAGDYPSTVTLFEQRSIWARTTNAPNAVWASRTGQRENMDKSRPARADDSLSFSVVAGRVNAVNQLVSTSALLALTSDSIFTVDGDGGGGVLTGDSPPAVRRQIGRGASRLPPLVIDNVVFYAPSVGASVRTANYSFDVDGLKSNDVSIFSPHFFKQLGIVSWAYAQEPRSLIWAARDDGKLLCFTWEQEQGVWGWTLCETDGFVESVCAISEGGEDRLYLLVRREFPSGTRRFIERLDSHTWDDFRTACYLDCAISGVAASDKATFGGLWHLEGRTDVSAMVGGLHYPNLTVTDGMVTLPEAAPAGANVIIGLPYQVDVKTLPIRSNSQGMGTNVGRRQQPGKIVMTLQDSSNILVGLDENNLKALKQRTVEAYGDPSNLLNGDYEAATVGATQNNVEAHIRQTEPYPLTILGIGIEPVVSE
mgnify:CR=1 FL=1